MLSKKLLLVDNREEFFEECVPELKSIGFDVCTANSYNEALKKFDECNPDIVITRLMLEHYDTGLVLSYKIKQKKPQTFILLLTSSARTTGIKLSANTEEERNWVKADGILFEPMKIEDLVKIINKNFN